MREEGEGTIRGHTSDGAGEAAAGQVRWVDGTWGSGSSTGRRKTSGRESGGRRLSTRTQEGTIRGHTSDGAGEAAAGQVRYDGSMVRGDPEVVREGGRQAVERVAIDGSAYGKLDTWQEHILL